MPPEDGTDLDARPRVARPDDVAEPHSAPVITIEPHRHSLHLDPRELWEYRDLLYFLTWREISIRYKQTLLGFAWAITTIIAWFAILFTGEYPALLYHFATGALRWTTRVEAYLLLLTDDYPPFSLE